MPSELVLCGRRVTAHVDIGRQQPRAQQRHEQQHDVQCQGPQREAPQVTAVVPHRDGGGLNRGAARFNESEDGLRPSERGARSEGMTAHSESKGPCTSCRCAAQPRERSRTNLLRHRNLDGEACQLGPERLRVQPRREGVEGRDLRSRLAKPAIGSAGRPQARASRATTAPRWRARPAAAPRPIPARQADIRRRSPGNSARPRPRH